MEDRLFSFIILRFFCLNNLISISVFDICVFFYFRLVIYFFIITVSSFFC